MNIISRLTAFVLIGVFITMALPVAAALVLARRQAIEREEEFVRGLARSALSRTEMTAAQLETGARLLDTIGPDQACSDAGLDIMRRIDLTSTLLQAVGHTEGNIMVCSSIGGRRAFDLGPPTLRSATGALLRTDVRLIDENTSYIAFEGRSLIGIVHRDLPLSFVEEVPELTIGVFNWSERHMLLSRGTVVPAWVRNRRGEAVFRDRDHLVAVVRSKRYDLGGVAALPLSQTTGFVRDAALVLLPIGMIGGVLLSAAFVHAMRIRGSMPAAIRSGMKAAEFRLVYQPIVDLATGQAVGAEALLRWQRAKGETIPPDTFIAVAEAAGLMPLVTRCVLALLARDARRIAQAAPELYVAVNFAAADMHRAEIVEEVQHFVADSGLPFGNFVIETTERSLMEVERVRVPIGELRSLGVRIAIDDFGTGYSSLGYLAQLEVDHLKIDRLFVQALGTDSATSQVAARIIQMARDLKLRIVAEGVETEAQAQQLREFDVDLAQGFLFARPMSIDDLLTWLRDERPSNPR